MKIIYAITLLLFLACENPNDGDIVESMPQEHMPWPSLADSPWPMYRHDPQGTSRSHLEYPIPSEITCTYEIESIFSGNAITGAVTGLDSTIYFCSSYEITDLIPTQNSYLYAMITDCMVKWKRPVNWMESENSPLVRSDGSIIYSAFRKVLAFDKEGNELWQYDAMYPSEMNIGIDGTLYYTDTNGLYALNPDGSVLWYQEKSNTYNSSCGVSISPDGSTLYVTGYLTIDHLYAIDSQTGQTIWVYTGVDSTLESTVRPIVDNQGNIYFGIQQSYYSTGNESSYMVCLSSEGKELWKNDYYPTQDRFTIDSNGHITISDVENLIQLDYSGNEQWIVYLGGNYTYKPLLCDVNGIVYTFGYSGFKAISPSDGSSIVEVDFVDSPIQYPILGYDGIWFSTTNDSGFNKIQLIE